MTSQRDTVLVIDDDVDLRTLISELGNIVGVRVIHAPNCCDGLKVLEEEFSRIKVILLDYFMPGMTPSACAQALQKKINNEIPIILVTASVDPAERAAELNLPHWISKPFDIGFMQNVLISGSAN